MSFGGATLLYLLVERPSMLARELPAVRRLAAPAGVAQRAELGARAKP
jgi:hypothetical protein